MVLGCLDSCNNRVESPQTICYNLVRLAGVVGPDRVMVRSDCGFSTTAESGSRTEAAVWLNLKSLVRGVNASSSTRVSVTETSEESLGKLYQCHRKYLVS